MEGAVHASRRSRCVAGVAAGRGGRQPATDVARHVGQGDSARCRSRQRRRVSLNLWTGTTTSPSAATLRDRNNFVDLTNPLAKIRWVVRTSGFHQVRPVIKLADGTWLVGDRPTGPSADFNETDISIADLHWMKLDIARVVAVGNWIDQVDLSRVDEVGFADLMPGSGHGPGGYVNVGRIEVYGKPVKR